MVGADQDITKGGTTLYIPLEFWFCRNIGLSLPLIALQYHEVKVKVEFETATNCSYSLSTNDTVSPSSVPKLGAVNLWVDYIFLDTDERRKFAQLSHEYLIEQLQTFTEGLTGGQTQNYRINFNHPCKELVWVAKLSKSTTVNQWYNYTTTTTNGFPNGAAVIGAATAQTFDSNIHAFTESVDSSQSTLLSKIVYNVEPGFIKNAQNPFTNCLLRLNGNDRFAAREGSYFNYVQPYQHHTNIPANCGINVYSFALKPEEHQPSGTLNMSRIDSAILQVTNKYASGKSGSILIYATNYNVLRILSGMGGLAYSN